MTMGDMKTPDFDDLLAAFDIPDMVDPKAAIESGHDDHESHMKQNAHGEDDSHAPSSSDWVVSVIVKIRTARTPLAKALHNGFLTASSWSKSLKGEVAYSTFSQFSPISNRAGVPPDKEDVRSSFRSMCVDGVAEGTRGENSSKTGLSTSGNVEKNKVLERNRSQFYKPEKALTRCSKSRVLDGKPSSRENDTSLPTVAPSKTKSSPPTSSVRIVAAIAALTLKRRFRLLQRTVSKGSRPLPGSTQQSPKSRTVTRVLPEKPSEQTASVMASVTSLLSSPASAAVNFPLPRAPSSLPVVTKVQFPLQSSPPKQVTIKPVATAFLPVSAVKTASPNSANCLWCRHPGLANAKLRAKDCAPCHLNLLPQGAQLLTKPQHTNKSSLAKPPQKGVLVQMCRPWQICGEAFNKVLSSVNPVPVYIPNLSPPANAGITLPTRGYKCLECGDSFALEKSLTQHYDRRSVRIEVTCNHCTKNLVFYNKCSLLSHARGHKEKGVVMQCSHLILKPVPADQMIVSPSSNTSTSTSTLQSPVGAGTHTVTKIQSGITGTVISAPSSTPITPAMPLDEDPSKLCRHSLKCLECNEVFQDETSLATHFQQAADTSGQKTCTICQMLLPNQCSYASHQRIHQHKSPYTCPECGAICRSVHFQTHVTKNCLHYTRRVGFRCVHCNVVYSDVAALKSHIQGSHCEVFYKCPICPMAFKSAPSTHSHAYTQHPGIKIGEPKIIYKCSMCDTVFTLQTLLYRHFDQHIENQKVSVFKCPDCSLLYAQKQLMMDHIKSMHGTLKSIEGPPNLGINLPLSIKPATQNSANQNKEDTKSMNGKEKLEKKSPSPVKKSMETKKVASPGWTCWECDCLFMQRDVYISHVRKEHGKQMKKHPCRQCDKSFSSSHSLCRHNRIKHKGIRKVYACSHCPDSRRTFTKRLMLEKHVQLMHGIKDPDLKEMTDATNEEETEIKEDTKVPSPKRKLEEPVLEFRPPRGAITQPLKKLKINVFKVHKCAVCGFTTENLLQFHEHIPQHKSDGSSYQCRECGLCYTSHVSLSRHLFIVHKLKEPQPVSKQNGAGEDNQQENKPSHEDESPDGAVSDRKCKVCAKTFETEAALNTHMRTHGMAFIKSKG
uniref:Zinc finger protein 532 n=1 Tax=Pan troglodytes TaxID=9598 RepID=A0A2I3TVA1_PANTR